MASIRQALGRGPACVVVAPTGSGKTTRVAPALLDEVQGTVYLLEPRRIAARAAARRIATERGVQLGGEVGFATRDETRVGRDTRLIAATYGVFLRRLQSDPLLEGVGAVVFDEFHERSVEQDLCLALARRVRESLGMDLRLVVMSATIDPQPVASYLFDAAVVESAGRSFPVELLRTPARAHEPLDATIVRALQEHPPDDDGDVLVFLPGVGEIRRVRRALEGHTRVRELAELYGDLAPAAQDALFERGSKPRLILATNVAESSITLPHVTHVIDSGQVRRILRDPNTGLERLELGRVSLASAEQRRGRAGRVRPGRCVRLLSEMQERGLARDETPEIRRVGVARAVLELLAWGENDLEEFPWFEAPSAEALEAGFDELRALGAVADTSLTEIGRRMAELPLAPRLARLLLAGVEHGVPDRAALAAAILSERDPFRTTGDRRGAPSDVSDSDLVDRVAVLEGDAVRGLEPRGFAVRGIRRNAERLRRAVSKRGARRVEGSEDDALRRALFDAFGDRLARRRAPDSPRALMTGGVGVELSHQSRVRGAEFFVALDMDGGRRGSGDALVRLASAVDRDWLDESEIEERVDAVFDASRERVVGVKRTTYRGLVLAEVEHGGLNAERAAEVLCREAAQDPSRALDLERPEIAALLARIAWLGELRPELELPKFDGDGDGVLELLPTLCAGKRSFAELRKAPLGSFVQGLLTHQQSRALDSEAPESLRVPSGSRIRLKYERGRSPVLAARIQELFGLAETPRLAGGRAGVVMHLLAPNGRPQQVTEDLASFWNGAYHDVRKELRRRYPKHAWPDDPWNAQAERRPGRRSK